MKWILSEALTQRVSALWKIWMRLPFIQLWSGMTAKRWYLLWIIFLRKNASVSGRTQPYSGKRTGVEEEYAASRTHREEKGEKNLPVQWLCEFSKVQKELNKLRAVSLSALEPRGVEWNFAPEKYKSDGAERNFL